MAELSRPPQKLNGAYYYPNAYPVGNNRKPRSSSSSSSYSRSRVGFCCRCCCSILLVIIILLGLATLFIYLFFHPKIPKYSVQDVKISALNITSSRAVDLDMTVSLRAENPNKKIGIKYKSINTELSFSATPLGSASVPAFFQPKRNVTIIHMRIRGSKVPVAQSVASSLKSSLDRDSILLTTHTTVKAKIKAGKLTTPAIKIRVSCALRVSSPTSAGGARLLSKACKVKRGKIW